MEEEKKSKILILAGTGYLGKYMVKASVSLGHPTFVYVRPPVTEAPVMPNSSVTATMAEASSSSSDNKDDNNNNSNKLQLLKEFESMGVTIFQGEFDEHEKLVSIFRQVDVVISTLAVPQHLHQLKLIHAMKAAGNIKRFVPSEFGNEVDRVTGLPPFQRLLENKKKIRRATEEAGIPFTYVSANAFAAYFINILIHPHLKDNDEVTIYGTGKASVVLNYEKDVAMYTIKAATDPRVENRLIILRPPKNIITQLDLVSLWEQKIGRKLKKIHIPEEQILHLSETLPVPDNISVSIIHNIFIKGEQMSFELTENDLEASKLYPDYTYTSVDDLLNLCLLNPPNVKFASFA